MTTTYTVPKSTYSGTVTSPAYAWPAGATSADLLATQMSQAELGNSALSLQAEVRASYDGGATWITETTYTWTGGADSGSSPPELEWGIDPQHPPTNVQVQAVFAAPITCGFTVTVS